MHTKKRSHNDLIGSPIQDCTWHSQPKACDDCLVRHPPILELVDHELTSPLGYSVPIAFAQNWLVPFPSFAGPTRVSVDRVEVFAGRNWRDPHRWTCTKAERISTENWRGSVQPIALTIEHQTHSNVHRYRWFETVSSFAHTSDRSNRILWSALYVDGLFGNHWFLIGCDDAPTHIPGVASLDNLIHFFV